MKISQAVELSRLLFEKLNIIVTASPLFAMVSDIYNNYLHNDFKHFAKFGT